MWTELLTIMEQDQMTFTVNIDVLGSFIKIMALLTSSLLLFQVNDRFKEDWYYS